MRGQQEYERIINNIKKIIQEKGMKYNVVAERAGFSQSEFSHILNDRRKLLRVEHLKPLADVLEVPIEAFYEEEPHATANSTEPVKFIPEDSCGKHLPSEGMRNPY